MQTNRKIARALGDRSGFTLVEVLVASMILVVALLTLASMFPMGYKQITDAGRIAGCSGAWVDGKKIGAIGVHISRWVTSHGFALNVNTDLSYFGYIVPCGLLRPVTSMAQLGVDAALPDVNARLATHFGLVFDREILEPALEKAS